MHRAGNERSTQLLPKAISEEFVRLGGRPESPLQSIQNTLQSIGIIANDERLLSYSDETEWYRGGAETYASIFKATTQANPVDIHYHIICKAIVKWGIGADQVATSWLQRQLRLSAFGVCTPRHYGNWKGIFFQEFITFELKDYLQSVPAEKKLRMALDLLDTARRVDKAGFKPSSFLHDIRTDGSAIFIVDFGEDLGHFSDGQQGNISFNRTMSWLKNNFEDMVFEIESLRKEGA
ncbi:MAG TPA: hypothetical protein VGN86_17830 [Pyrinomonadaceae bacterium]|jgi:hypothetical protein|nr:hypothetical protein [Pyrinomonadaceae bacterium]